MPETDRVIANDKKLGVAIHGAGSVARAHVASWQKNPHATIVSVSSRSRDSASKLVNEMSLDCEVNESYEDVLRSEFVQVVDLTGPNHVHAEQAIAAAEAGKHLLIEKPMALTEEENSALRNAVRDAGVKTVVSFVLRWNPLFANLKSLLSAQAIGDLIYAEVDYWHGIGTWYSGWEWAHRRATGGSAMLLAGCHAVDALRWLADDEVTEVSAFANNKKGLYEYDANVVAMVKFRNGAIGKTSTLFDCEMPYSFNIDLIGTEGALRDNRLWSKSLLPGQTDWSTLPTVLPDSGEVEHHPFDAEINHFVDCIQSETESHCSVADAYKTHELCLAIDKSIAEQGVVISLPNS